MQKIKTSPKMRKIANKIAHQYATYEIAVNALNSHDWNLSDGLLSGDFDNSYTEEDWEYMRASAEMFADHENILLHLNAEYAAAFLIANHIARRGKLLHPDTAIKKLQKYGDAGKPVINAIDRPVVSNIVNATPYIHHALYKNYGVILMDANMYEYVLHMVDRHEWSRGNVFARRDEKRLQKYENFAKKFHTSVLNKIKAAYQQDEKTF